MAGARVKREMRRSVSSESEEPLADPLDVIKMPVMSRNGTQKIVSALHIGFMEPRHYVLYKPLPCLISANSECPKADEEEWLERMLLLENDLHWLLKLPHHRFWSQIVYDESLQRCLQSYLSHAPRDYDLNTMVSDNVANYHKWIHRLVFLVFLRMSTYKESRLHYITPNVFGDIIYDNFVFDIPRMMDLCVLYGFKNQPIISKMVNSFFSNQPKYYDDLDEVSATVLMAFDSVEERLQLKNTSESSDKGLKLSEHTEVLKSFTNAEIQDIINYLTDTSATLYTFLEAFPPACDMFIKHDAATRIPMFYDSVLPLLEKELKLRIQSDMSKRTHNGLNITSSKLILTKTLLVKVFRYHIVNHCIQGILDSRYMESTSSTNSSNEHVEFYLQTFTDVVMGKTFKNDYQRLYPIQDDLELFAEAEVNLDSTRAEYILCSIQTDDSLINDEINSEKPDVQPSSSQKKTKAQGPIKSLLDLAATLKPNNAPLNDEGYGNCEAAPLKPDRVMIDSLIQAVQDVIPAHGSGFVEACLDYYNYNEENVIDALLTDSLPECLNTLDRSAQKLPSSQNLKQEDDSYSVLKSRRNIYDGDEFDVFNREDVDMSKIHKGKTQKTPQSYNSLINSESDANLLKERTLDYYDNYEDEDERRRYIFEPNMYDDEYDDTYDSHEVSIQEQQPETELYRPFTVPMVLRQSKRNNEINNQPPEEEEDECGAPSDIIVEKRDEFCVNPEILRQKAEARREAQLRNRGHSSDNRPPQDFRNKGRHKGQVANHNRRHQSDFKRSRGMGGFPTR